MFCVFKVLNSAVYSMFSGFLCRMVFPPINPTGGFSDLLPGPGAGMYPTRYCTSTNHDVDGHCSLHPVLLFQI